MADHTFRNEGLVSGAISLIQRAWGQYDREYTAGCMSCAIYDTAWVSMVTKKTSGEKRWLFPESFDYLLSMQSDDGSWKADGTPQVDGILNTAASLLSLQKHRLDPLNTTDNALDDIESRIHRATSSLASQLKEWDVTATVHVGFEIIVPSLLAILRAEHFLTDFEFDGEEILGQINSAKLSGFKPEMLYSREPSTAVHSLEAFIGKVDFNKLTHHLTKGSMMGSPSSTAAYLIHASRWDEEAEAYLRHVIAEGAGKGSGAVPSAFPSAFFEYTWILSVMLSAGFSRAELSCTETEEMITMLNLAFDKSEGLLGFAPGLPPDVDDTAQCIVCLTKLGRDASPERMIETFEAQTHFRTYASERNPSFTANCNVLSALLAQSEASQYSDQILKIVEFLCNCWWESDGYIKDKWNRSHLYASLLAVQSIMDLLIQIDKGNLKPLSPGMQSKINITLFQICFRALLDTPDPTCIEATAYQILILCKARGLPILRSIRAELNHEITSQASFLSGTHRSESDSIANNVWIEKVSFGSPLLTQSYKLAAIKAASSCTDEVPLGSPSIPISSSENDANYVRLLKKTPLFESTPEWQVRASMLEASLFQPLLRDRRLNIFPRKDMAPDRYFDLIPLTWISCNNRTKVFASNRFIFDMMIISFLDFQADEFMEAVAGPSYKGGMDHLHQLIDDICDTIESNSSAKRNNKRRKNSDKNSSESSEAERNELSTFDSVSPNGSFHKSNGHKSQRGQDEVREILSRFVLHIVHHPSVRSASHWNRTATLRELRIYLHAHATQSADNARLALARKAVWKLEEAKTSLTSRIQGQYSDSYFRWVRTTSGDHTACPYSFAFAGCLLSTQLNGIETFPTTKAKYLASAACQHLATMCRMYNDYGSIARDRVECNLNSLDFAEFASDNDAKTSGKTGTQEEIVEEHCDASLMQAKKKTLYELAQYERSWLSDVMRRLRDEMQGSQKRRQLDIWNMFCDVTDLYGQIYVVKDIASRMKGT